MISFNRVDKYYGAQTVLEDVSFKLLPGEKVGLIGPNGAGKTTLTRLLTGKEESSSGTVTRENDTSFGYVPQYLDFEDEQTSIDVLLADFRCIEVELKSKENDLSSPSKQQNLKKVLSQYQRVRDVFDSVRGYELPKRAETLLESMGLGEKMHQKVGSLSGGEKNVLSLARALLKRPNFLILDEPGNHLDYIGLAWLESYLSNYPGSVMITNSGAKPA